MQKGQVVTVVNFERTKLPMRVAGLIGDVVLVCREEEFRTAEKEGRKPRSVGFKKQWILESSNRK
jgi:hypothetical protein